jgi:hypothetical protein
MSAYWDLKEKQAIFDFYCLFSSRHVKLKSIGATLLSILKEKNTEQFNAEISRGCFQSQYKFFVSAKIYI